MNFIQLLAITLALCAIQPSWAMQPETADKKALNKQFLSAVEEFLIYAQQKDLIKAEQLLSQGADINATNEYKETSLIRATKHKNEPVCKFLLEHGANVNAQTEHGQTALMAAAHNGNAAICALLIAHKADVNLKNTKGSTALLLLACSKEKNKEVCKMLLNAGAEVDAHRDSQDTPLLEAASHYRYNEVCKILIEHDADINAQSVRDGTTPLMYYVCNIRSDDDAQIFRLC
jgi:ankyrin repeat protein